MRCIPTLNILLDKFNKVIHKVQSLFQPNQKSNNNHEIDDRNRSGMGVIQETTPQVQPTGSETIQ